MENVQDEKQLAISIIVPVFNVENYLPRCIESVLRQKDVPLELILVDDGSTDGSGEICDACRADPRVRVIHQSNRGVSAARNAGMDEAKGEFLLFTDADDWLEENALSTVMQNARGADMIAFGVYNAKENGDGSFSFTERIRWDEPSQPCIPVRDVYLEIFNINVTLWNKAMRREAVGALRFNEEMRYGEDADFLCRALDRMQTAVIVPRPLYYYFVNRPGSVVSSGLDERSYEFLANSLKIYEHLALRGRPSVGIRRMVIASKEVFSKIPLTREGIKENRKMTAGIRAVLKRPPLRSVLAFCLDGSTEGTFKRWYWLLRSAPVTLRVFCLLKKRKRTT